jgi:integrase
MTATVQTKKGRPNYSIVIRYPDETTGKEHQKWVKTDIPVKGYNRRRAEQRRDEVLAQYTRDKVDLGKDDYFAGYIRNWLESLKSAKSIAPTTYDTYKLNLSAHIVPYFEPLRLRVKDIKPQHIQQYVNQKLESLSPNTVKKHVINISACLETAVRQNIIAFNPAKRIEPIHKVKYTGAKHYNEKQIEQLLECSQGDPLEIVILITLFYGLRRSEVLGLKWDAIDFDNNTVTIRHTVTKINKTTYYRDATKNDASNDVLPLPGVLKAHLKE